MSRQYNLCDDDGTTTMLWANTWGGIFLVFALLLDIVYRSAAWHEASWDLLLLLAITGVIQFAYPAWHHVLILNRKHIWIVILGSIVAAIVSYWLAITKVF